METEQLYKTGFIRELSFSSFNPSQTRGLLKIHFLRFVIKPLVPTRYLNHMNGERVNSNKMQLETF